MGTVRANEVRAFLLDYFSDPLHLRSVDLDRVPDDFDLLSEGVMDSLGILEMVSAVEGRFAIQLDLEELEPEDLTRIGPFSRYVEAQGSDNERP